MPKKIFLLILAAFLVCAPVFADQPQDKPFAIVELFSSEGCSSCPSADAIVTKLTAWARRNNQPVYPLVFHVDYWNGLGWADAFSRPEFTQRQDAYAQVFQQEMYTPQMIVNGRDFFVGSDQGHLENDLDHELTVPAQVLLQMSVTLKGPQVIVNYVAQGFSQGDLANIALVQRGLSAKVTAGENAGSTLHHDSVVREFVATPLTLAASQVTIPIKAISDLKQASVIVYVQDPRTMSIKAAKQVDLG